MSRVNVENLLPENYYKGSRDFQLLGRIFEVALNYNKTGADMVLNNILSDNSDVRILDLVAKTLGFDSKHEYNVNDLMALCKSFKKIMFKKGTVEAIEECVNVLLKAQDITSQARVFCDNESDPTDPTVKAYNIRILIPQELNDVILLEDMLDYVLPTGYTYNILRAAVTDDVYVDYAAVNPDIIATASKKTQELSSVPTVNSEGAATTNNGVVAPGLEGDTEIPIVQEE